MTELDLTNGTQAIGNTDGQCDRATSALRLICDALTENVESFREGAALLGLAGLRLVCRHGVPSSPERSRLLALVKRVGAPSGVIDRDVADDLIDEAFAGKKPDFFGCLIERCKVTARPVVQ